MNAPPFFHPSEQTLNSYGLGKLDDASAEAVDKHLEECPDCRKRVAEMSADSFLGRVRDAQSGQSTFGQFGPTGRAVTMNRGPPRRPLPTRCLRACLKTPIMTSRKNSAEAGWGWSTSPTTG